MAKGKPNFSFTENDIKLLKRCIDNPEQYKIEVDNDELWVVDEYADYDCDDYLPHDFSSFGEDFIIGILQYLGCDADWC